MAEKKGKAGPAAVIAALGGLLTGGAALWTAMSDRNESDLMFKSMYALSAGPISDLRERVAVLEATCQTEHHPVMMMLDKPDEAGPPEVAECESDEDCEPAFMCEAGHCVEEPVPEPAPQPAPEFPKFEDIRQHVQQKAAPWTYERRE